MLLTMKSQTEAMRALAGVTAVSLDAARLHPLAAERERHQAFADLMIPVIKGWCTENSVEIASLGIQVHGGVGFVEVTGAAQFYRDARITPIYEGTTGIQANDLIGRKIARDNGHAVAAVVVEMRTLLEELSRVPDLAAMAATFSGALDALEQAVAYVVDNYAKDIRAVSVGAVPLLKLCGIVTGGWQLLRSALIARRRLEAAAKKGAGMGGAAGGTGGGADAGGAGAGGADAGFYESKILTARFYADHLLPQAPGLAHAVLHGAAAALAEGVL
jgi:acyl-CoA dehydrogenase